MNEEIQRKELTYEEVQRVKYALWSTRKRRHNSGS
jgi:hypothetical protein